MNDNPSARATHERGIKHQENVARSKCYFAGCDLFKEVPKGAYPLCLLAELRQMRQQADTEKRDQAEAEKNMADIEARAHRAYKEDLKLRSQAEEELTGIWVRSLQEAVHIR